MTIASTLDLSIGAQVVYAGATFEIKSPLSMTSFLIQNCTSGQQVVAPLDELRPCVPIDSPAHVHESDLVTLAAKDWEEAQCREAVIAPLAMLDELPADLAKQAAKQLSLSPRTIYTSFSATGLRVVC